MKRLVVSLFLASLALVTPAQAWISDWNVTTATRTGAAQYSNHHPFLGLFGAGTTHLSESESEAALASYLTACREDAPTNLDSTTLKDKFRSLFISSNPDASYNLLCSAQLDQDDLDGYQVVFIDGTTTRNLFIDADAADCATTDTLNALYDEWLDSLTNDDLEYDFRIATGATYVNPFVGTQTITPTHFNTVGSAPDDFTTFTDNYTADHLLAVLSGIPAEKRIISFDSRVFDRAGNVSQRRVLTTEQKNRFVQLLLSDANIKVIQNVISEELAATVPAGFENRKFVRVTHRLLNFLFNREDDYRFNSNMPSLFEIEAFRLIDETPNLITVCEELNAVPVANQAMVESLITSHVSTANASSINLGTYPNGVDGVRIFADTAASAAHYQIVSFSELIGLALGTQITATEAAEALSATTSANADIAIAAALAQAETSSVSAAVLQQRVAALQALLDAAEAEIADVHDFVFQASDTVNNVRSLRLIRLIASANTVRTLQYDNAGQSTSAIGTVSSLPSGAGEMLGEQQLISGSSMGALLRDVNETGHITLCSYVQMTGQPDTTYLIVATQQADTSFDLASFLVIDENQIQNLVLNASGDVVGQRFNKTPGRACHFTPVE